MSCDEYYHRHFHKKITHKHPHSNDVHHRHQHSESPKDRNYPLSESAEGSDHFHEHTHEAAEHEHSVRHDPLHPCDESKMHTTEKRSLLKGGKESEMHGYEPI